MPEHVGEIALRLEENENSYWVSVEGELYEPIYELIVDDIEISAEEFEYIEAFWDEAYIDYEELKDGYSFEISTDRI